MYKVTAHDIKTVLRSLTSSAKTVAARMLVLQSQLSGANSQSLVSFYDQGRLDDCRRRYQEKINFSLHGLKDYYHFYQSTLAPDLQRWVASIDSCFSVQQLRHAYETALQCKQKGKELVNELSLFRDSMSHEASRCDAATMALNSVMNGDTNILSAISNQLNMMDTHFSQSVMESVYSSVGQKDITFTVAIGHVAELFTTSKPTHLVLGSAAIISQGLESQVTDTVHQASLLNRKSELVNHSTGLHSEVMLSLGITSGMNKLSHDISDLLNSVRQMARCWHSLAEGLKHVIEGIEGKKLSSDTIMQPLGSVAEDSGYTGQFEVDIMLRQLRAVELISDPETSITSLLLTSTRPKITLCPDSLASTGVISTANRWCH